MRTRAARAGLGSGRAQAGRGGAEAGEAARMLEPLGMDPEEAGRIQRVRPGASSPEKASEGMSRARIHGARPGGASTERFHGV